MFNRSGTKMLIHTAIEQKLLDAFKPVFLDVIDESANHNVPVGTESHFKVVIVSEAFDGLRLVQRHQKVYAAVGDLLAPSRIHALALHAFVESEWQGQDTSSPECAHAPKH